MADAISNIVRTMAPEKMAQELGSDGFVKAGFENLSLALSSLDVDKNTAGIVLLLYVDLAAIMLLNQGLCAPMSCSFPFLLSVT